MNAIVKKTFSIILSVTVLLSTIGFVACKREIDVPITDDRPEIVIGSDIFAPYFFVDEDGEFSGVDVALATEAFSRIGYKVRFVSINWSDKDSLLESGEVDCLWGGFSMEGRESRYDWSEPYLKDRQMVVVLNDSDIYKLSDLEGKSIAVQATSKPEELFSQRTDPRIPSIKKLYCMPDMDYICGALNTGYADAAAGHEAEFNEYFKFSATNYRVLEETLLEVELGVAFKKGANAELINRLNQSLSVMQSDGYVGKVVKEYGLDYEKVILSK